MNSSKRIEEILNDQHISANKLAKEIGYSSSTKIQHIKNGRNEISAEVAGDIVNRFSEYNYEWVYKGTGVKYREIENVYTKDVSIKDLPHGDQMEMLQNEILDLKKELKEQRDLNKDYASKIIDYIDEYLKPVFDFMQETVEHKKKENT